MMLVLNTNKFALGILYINLNRRSYEDNVQVYEKDKRPLYQRDLDREKLNTLLGSFR